MGAQGIDMPPPEFDTMVASFSAVGAARRHNLDDLALRYFDLHKIPTTALIGTGKSQITMAQVPVEKVAEYACEDADVTWRLWSRSSPSSRENGRRAPVPRPRDAARAGPRGDGAARDPARRPRPRRDRPRSSRPRSTSPSAEIHALAGEPFNLNSTKALGEVLFEKLKIQDAAGVKRPRKTQTGYSTDAATLEQLYGDLPIVAALLEYREMQKLKSTYVDALPRYVNPKDGRVHSSFSQISAATGRLASSDPNLQNIPVRTERGRELRKAFVPREPDALGHWVLMSADYSQVELRILAHLSGDPGLVRRLRRGPRHPRRDRGDDLRRAPDAVTREMRSRAKAINFGLMYGMGPARLARETELTVPEAKQFIERYFESFPKRAAAGSTTTLEKAREKGYVETISGRRRRFADLNSDDARVRVFAENAAVNTPVPGSAADVIKHAMIDLEARLAASKLAGRMLLQVHDELVFEVPVRELDETRELVRDRMENAWPLKVPLKVDFGHGANWLEAH